VITDRDLVVRIMAHGIDPGEIRAGEIPDRDVIAFRDSMGIYEAIQKMTAEGIRRMPVVDDTGGLIGIVTMDDIIQMLGEEMAAIAKNIEKQSPHLSEEAPPVPV
ncbi:MAG: CBS domain-containing protein, partial [Methanomicrobiales archaeon]|nr:CBS domain-containing protein [Methanomicrobiales archaeon]